MPTLTQKMPLFSVTGGVRVVFCLYDLMLSTYYVGRPLWSGDLEMEGGANRSGAYRDLPMVDLTSWIYNVDG